MGVDVLQIGAATGDPNMLPLSWVVLVGLQSAFFLGFTMGANDVANAFGSSVGAGVLSIKQACVIAAIFDVAGSLTLGAGVSSTVATKIIDVQIYQNTPGLFMLGMMAASIGAAGCVASATRLGYPISTTHAVIGAVAGFSFVETTDGIIWLEGKHGLGAIFLSWIVSPIFSGIFAAGVYTLVKIYCLEVNNLELALKKQKKLCSIIIAWVAALICVFILYDVNDGGDNNESYHAVNLGSSICAFLAVGALAYFFLLPFLSARYGKPLLKLGVDVWEDAEEALIANDTISADAVAPTKLEEQPLRVSSDTVSYSTAGENTSGKSTTTTRNELPDGITYDPELEKNFMPMCVMTASFMAFTHGANDIGNAAGPLVAIWDVYQAGIVDSEAEVQYWILFICCTGVVAGLLIWGGYVIMTVGHNITKMTPSKAVSIELGTATSVLIASFLRMPVSSTHCFIGAVIAVGLLNGEGRKAIKWKMVSKIVVSWVVTVPLAGMVSAAVYAALKPATDGVLAPVGYTMAFFNGTFPFNETAACV